MANSDIFKLTTDAAADTAALISKIGDSECGPVWRKRLECAIRNLAKYSATGLAPVAMTSDNSILWLDLKVGIQQAAIGLGSRGVQPEDLLDIMRGSEGSLVAPEKRLEALFILLVRSSRSKEDLEKRIWEQALTKLRSMTAQLSRDAQIPVSTLDAFILNLASSVCVTESNVSSIRNVDSSAFGLGQIIAPTRQWCYATLWPTQAEDECEDAYQGRSGSRMKYAVQWLCLLGYLISRVSAAMTYLAVPSNADKVIFGSRWTSYVTAKLGNEAELRTDWSNGSAYQRMLVLARNFYGTGSLPYPAYSGDNKQFKFNKRTFAAEARLIDSAGWTVARLMAPENRDLTLPTSSAAGGQGSPTLVKIPTRPC